MASVKTRAANGVHTWPAAKTSAEALAALAVTAVDVNTDGSTAALEQARTVLDHYRREAPPARSVHFNFMARGEPLASRTLLLDADGLLGELSRLAVALRLPDLAKVAVMVSRPLRFVRALLPAKPTVAPPSEADLPRLVGTVTVKTKPEDRPAAADHGPEQVRSDRPHGPVLVDPDVDRLPPAEQPVDPAVPVRNPR